MAVFEPDRARIVLRIVYDGPGRAGKTTNVEQLARIFGTRPGDELQVHPAATGRTIFFDWFSFDGGVLDGQQLQVQVVTVPGHKSLEPRRAHILRGADVVVLVCDSAVSGQDSAREMLDSLREHLGKSAVHVPLLVQANKQDLPSAMLPHELGAALRLGPDVPVIGAQASAGIGVRETAVGAIRAAVRQMKQRTASEGLGALAGQAGTAEQLRAALQTIESLGAHRSADDDARRAPSRPQPDEGRVVYIRSAKRSTPLAGDADVSALPRKPPVSENMSEKPAAERPARLKVPVSAMFIEPTPHVEPPDIPSPPAPTVRVPPPPVLAHTDAPLAVTEPFDPEEVRSEPDTPIAPASYGDLRERWPTEAQPLSEEPPDPATDEAAPSPAATPAPSLDEAPPHSGDEREPSEAASPAAELAPTQAVPEDSLSRASSTPDWTEAADPPAPPAHVPEDSHPPALPAQEDSSSGTNPPAHIREGSDPSALPVQAAATSLSRTHVPKDSHLPGRPAQEDSSGAATPISHVFGDSEPPQIHLPEESSSAAAPASPGHASEGSRFSNPSVQEDSSAAATPASPAHAPGDSDPPEPPAREDSSAAATLLAHDPEDSLSPDRPAPQDLSAATSSAHVPEDSLSLDRPAPQDLSAATSSAHVPEDSLSQDPPAPRGLSAATPSAHVPEDGRSQDHPTPRDLSAATPSAHVPEDSHPADAPVSSAPGPDDASPAPAEAALEDRHPASEPQSSLSVAEDSAATTGASSPTDPREARHPSAELTPSAPAQEEPPPEPAEHDPAAAERRSPAPVPEDSVPSPSPAAEILVSAPPVPEDSVLSSSPAVAGDAPASPVPEDSVLSSSPAAEDVGIDRPVPEDSITSSSPVAEGAAVPNAPEVNPGASSPPVPEDTQTSPVPEATEPPPDDLAVPRPDLPPGHVWPVPAGRHVLERIAGRPLVRARPPGHASEDMLYKTGGFCLRTRPEWRFGDDERGRAALREHVRRAARLGPLLPADTAVALALGDGDHVLWHIAPDLPALGAELRAAGPERPRQLARLASAYASALRLGAREGLALDLDPHAFAEQDGRWVYLSDRLGERVPAEALIHALLHSPVAPLGAWLDALDQVLPTVLTRDDVTALGLESALTEAAPEAHLRAILERCA